MSLGGIGEYIDLIFSYLRWTRLGVDYQNGNNISHPATENGTVLDAVRHDHLLAGFVILVVLITARQGWRYAAEKARLEEIKDTKACERMKKAIDNKLGALEVGQLALKQQQLDEQLKKQRSKSEFVRLKNMEFKLEEEKTESSINLRCWIT